MATSSTMKAIGFKVTGGVEVLEELELPVPTPEGRQLLVKIHAVSVNPVDCKVRDGFGNPGNAKEPAAVVGYDASGVVAAVGPDATLFKVGDEVFYAGSIAKPGTNSEYHLVEEAIVGKKPSSLSHAEASAMPLVSLTAYEGLYEQLLMPREDDPSSYDRFETETPTLLVVNGAGGVGSTIIQLVRALSPSVKIIATASRPETIEFCKSLGAHATINHHKDFKEELAAIGHEGGINYAFAAVDVDKCWSQIISVAAPMIRICAITVGDASKVTVNDLFNIRGSLSWELMFTRPISGVRAERQHAILNHVADMLDSGKLKTTMTSSKPYSLESLKEAHTAQDSGRLIGKQVLTFE